MVKKRVLASAVATIALILSITSRPLMFASADQTSEDRDCEYGDGYTGCSASSSNPTHNPLATPTPDPTCESDLKDCNKAVAKGVKDGLDACSALLTEPSNPPTKPTYDGPIDVFEYTECVQIINDNSLVGAQNCRNAYDKCKLALLPH